MWHDVKKSTMYSQWSYGSVKGKDKNEITQKKTAWMLRYK